MKSRRLPHKAYGLYPRSEAFRLTEQGLNKTRKSDSLFVANRKKGNG
jgi:hypothetical protein